MLVKKTNSTESRIYLQYKWRIVSTYTSSGFPSTLSPLSPGILLMCIISFTTETVSLVSLEGVSG